MGHCIGSDSELFTFAPPDSSASGRRLLDDHFLGEARRDLRAHH